MALYKCTECGGTVSDKAETCPHCGSVIDSEGLREEERARRAAAEEVRAGRKHQIGYAVVLIVLGVAVAAIGAGLSSVTEDEKQTRTTVLVVGIGAIVLGLVWLAAIADALGRMRKAGVIPSCPKCGSPAVSGQKEGYQAGAGCCGGMLLGPLGLLCGFVGADEVSVHCLNCGHKWRARR